MSFSTGGHHAPGRRASRARAVARTAAAAPTTLVPARVALLATLAILAILAAAGLARAATDLPAAGGAESGGVPAPPAPAAVMPCAHLLRALDEAGRPLFQSVAVALAAPGLAAVPLHTLERGGARWSRLEVLAPGAPNAAAVTRLVAIDAEANLALLEAPGLAACAAAGAGGPVPADGVEAQAAAGDADAAAPAGRADAPVLAPGSALRVLRERVGYRPASIGGRVDRVVALPGGRFLTLVRLLDEGGADPGLVFDETGRLIGSLLPAPPAGRPSMAAFAAWSGDIVPGVMRTLDTDPRAALPPRESPSASTTTPSLVARALLAGGRDAAERGIALLGEVIGREGATAALHIERGVLEFGAGRLATAIADFERAATLDPASHLARYNLGIALGTMGRYADAAEAFLEARRLNPAHARTHYQLAVALKAARRSEEARREWEALAAIDPAMAGDLRTALGL